MKKNKVKKDIINPQNQIEYLFSHTATKKTIELCKKMIKDKQVREQTIAFIRAVDGKKIRNTSEV